MKLRLKSTRLVKLVHKKVTKREKFLRDARYYEWGDLYLFKLRADNLLRRCVTKEEPESILWNCHNFPYGGHYGGDWTVVKVLQFGFF